jgi:Zn-finger nucleic acid-binding protein
MQCPKCGSGLVTFGDGTVNAARCSGCGGMWLDASGTTDRERLRAIAKVDSGDERTGRQYDAMRDIECPRCAVKMLTLADATQPHIGFESCPECGGSFFDAGELRDLSELTIAERLKTLIADLFPVR